MTPRLLVSVRDVDEALAAADAGADFIDLKEPSAGALGALSPARIAVIVDVLRARDPARTLSATTGDWPPGHHEGLLGCVGVVASCGVDYVKVGIAPGRTAPRLVRALAATGVPVVPVLLADAGVDERALDAALSHEAFPAVMLDLAEKRAGSLFDRVDTRSLGRFVRAVQRSGRLAGVAGALRLADLPAIRDLAPDFAGFRSAVCAGSRTGTLDGARVRQLREQLRDR
ncbi:MAG TPA: (5-formylfuran-3-yl)methyl phosphate synthase [Albitalea sp.]